MLFIIMMKMVVSNTEAAVSDLRYTLETLKLIDYEKENVIRAVNTQQTNEMELATKPKVLYF